MGDRCGRCSPGWRRRRAAGCLWGTGSTTALTPKKGDAATAPLAEKLLGPCRVLHCADEGGANVVGPAGTRPSSTFGNASGCAWINRAGYSCARAVASRWCCVAAAIAATATADEPAGDCRVRRRPARLEAATSARTAAARPLPHWPHAPPPASVELVEPACAGHDETPPASEAVEPVNRCRRCCVPLEPRVRQGFMRHAARDARRGQRHDHWP